MFAPVLPPMSIKTKSIFGDGTWPIFSFLPGLVSTLFSSGCRCVLGPNVFNPINSSWRVTSIDVGGVNLSQENVQHAHQLNFFIKHGHNINQPKTTSAMVTYCTLVSSGNKSKTTMLRCPRGDYQGWAVVRIL